jgi:hypothetical protein
MLALVENIIYMREMLAISGSTRRQGGLMHSRLSHYGNTNVNAFNKLTAAAGDEGLLGQPSMSTVDNTRLANLLVSAENFICMLRLSFISLLSNVIPQHLLTL